MPTTRQIYEARRTLGRIEQYARRLMRDSKLEPLMVEMARLLGRMWLAQARVIVREMNKRKSEAPLFEASPNEWMDSIVASAFADTASFSDDMEKVIGEAYGEGMLHGAGKIGIQGNLDLDNPRAVDVVRGRGSQLVKGINAETKSQLTTLLTTAADEGWSYTRTAKEITGKFKGFSGLKPQQHIRDRATLVAVTEIGQGYVDGNREVYDLLRDSGIPMVKRWDTMGDSRVSDGCRENARAGWIHYDDTFPSGHMSPLRFPGCRCDLESDMYDPAVHGGALSDRFPGFTDEDWEQIYYDKYDDIASALRNRGIQITSEPPEPPIDIDTASEKWFDYEFSQAVKEYQRTGKYDDVTVKRSADVLQKAAQGRTKYKTVYRGEVYDSMEKFRDRYEIGNVVTFDSLTSTSPVSDIAGIYTNPQFVGMDIDDPDAWMVVVRFVDNNGVRGFDRVAGAVQSGTEVLLPKGAKYKIKSVNFDRNTGMWNVDAVAM